MTDSMAPDVRERSVFIVVISFVFVVMGNCTLGPAHPLSRVPKGSGWWASI